jgi:hypothetical protein
VVNPTPQIANQTPAPFCTPGSVTLNASTFTGTNRIPAGTTYSWDEPAAITGLSGLGSGSNANSFTTGTLTNSTNAPITVVYTVTPTGGSTVGSCPGASFTVTVVVNPTPAAPNVCEIPASVCPPTGVTPGKAIIRVSNLMANAYYVLTQGSSVLTQQAPASVTTSTYLSFEVNPGANFEVHGEFRAPNGTTVLCSGGSATCTNLTVCNLTSSLTRQSVEPTQEVQKVQDITARIGSNKTKVLAAPNPFTDRVRFTLQSDVSGMGSLEIYNTIGQKIATVYQGYVEAGKTLNKEYVVKRAMRAELIYIFRVGDQKTTGKLLNW